MQCYLTNTDNILGYIDLKHHMRFTISQTLRSKICSDWQLCGTSRKTSLLKGTIERKYTLRSFYHRPF
ncbi:hypothetical protein EVA_05574 [gut metagenome]|uniref:Uncharacterized protein n=1 Tax=gut metagenome TaxID=749906 RepID=J9GZF5_9ZZZZ